MPTWQNLTYLYNFVIDIKKNLKKHIYTKKKIVPKFYLIIQTLFDLWLKVKVHKNRLVTGCNTMPHLKITRNNWLVLISIETTELTKIFMTFITEYQFDGLTMLTY